MLFTATVSCLRLLTRVRARRAVLLLTLPRKTYFLLWLEYKLRRRRNDAIKKQKSGVHTGVQAGSGAVGTGRTIQLGNGEDSGYAETNAVELRAHGGRACKEGIRRLMKQHGIKAQGKRKFVVTTDSKHTQQKTPLDAGLHQPNAVREKLVCGTVEGCRIMSALSDTEFRARS